MGEINWAKNALVQVISAKHYCITSKDSTLLSVLYTFGTFDLRMREMYVREHSKNGQYANANDSITNELFDWLKEEI